MPILIRALGRSGSRMLAKLVRGLVAPALLTPIAGASQAQEADASQSLGAARRDDVSPVVLAISGGISRGSYQAGANWALVEVFKLTRRPEIREEWNLPRYELQAMAGASAGSINGFLTAIELCGTGGPVPADESLFWRSWLNVGFDQLLPPDMPGDSAPTGVLSRRYFDAVLLPALSDRMARRPSGPAGCRIPVGATVSRVAPAEVEVAPEVTAVTQRYASVVEVRRGSGRLSFAPFDAVASDPEARRRLGEILLLPESGGVIADDDVFRLIKASSAFPGAFAPVEVRFRSTCAGTSPCIESDSFADGGLFDNNPIALAAGIHAVSRSPSDPRPDSSARLVFIDSDRLRGRFRDSVEARRHDQPDGGYRGIAALLRLAAGAVPSARQYELTSFARLLAWMPEVFVRDNILPTTRAFPIMGDQVAGFGAFLGRPFREADFYVGVYDALHFFAREACRAEGAGADDYDCTRRRLRALVESDELLYAGDRGAGAAGGSAPSAGALAVRWLYGWEFEPQSLAPGWPDADARPDEALLAAVLRAGAGLVRGGADLECGGNFIEAALCKNGFLEMLDEYGNTETRRAIDASISSRPRGACAPARWKSSPDDCYADESFQAFVRDPDRFVAGALEGMLHRLWRVEVTTERADAGPAFTGVAGLTEVIFHSTLGFRYRRGLAPNASSAPGGAGRIVATVVPNYLSLNLGSVGFEVGYRPTLHLGSSFAIGVTATPLHFVDDPAADRRSLWAGGGPHLLWKTNGFLITGLAGGVEWLRRWRGPPEPGGIDRKWAYTATTYLFAGKLRLNARVIPGNDSELYSGSLVGVSLGLSDLNGLVYWLLR